MAQQSRTSWPACAAKLAALIPLGRLQAAALAAGARDRRPWCVAVSGGPDSVALLLLLWAHFPGRRRRLTSLHFNHRLRGRASAGDAAFCRGLAAGLGLRHAAGSWTAGRKPGEAAARAARMDFLRREMARRRARTLWLAHQLDDVAETMLMRLARGSGTGGLAAPRPVHPTGDGRQHLRPLLGLRKREIVAALRRAGAAWRNDASNRRGDFFRNRVRRDVLPRWEKAAGRDALAGAALARERLEEDDTALEAWVDHARALHRGVLDLARLRGCPAAVWRRALHRWLLATRPDTDLSRRGFDDLLARIRAGRDTRFSLGAKGFALVQKNRLRFKKARLRSDQA